MLTFYFITVATIQLGLFFWMFRLWRKSGSIYPVFPLIVIAGIIYDNLIIGFGSFIGEGDVLKALNVPRFVIHALFTPMIMIFAFGVARRVGVGFAQSKGVHTAVCIFVTLMILLGIYEELFKMNLVLKSEEGTMRYKTDPSAPPIPAILTIVFTMTMGIFVWIKTKKPWFFLGSFLFFLMAPFAPRFVWLGNFGEIVMNLGNIFGEKLAHENRKD